MEFENRYITGEFLGLSPAGKCYEGEDKKFGRKVLIKVIDKVDEDIEKRFDNITKLSGQLIHPNILTTIDYQKVHDKLISVHEFIDYMHATLDLKKISLLSTKNKLRISINIADALDFCHKIGFYHNNILLDSIYLTENLNVKIDHCGLKRVITKNSIYSELSIDTTTPLFFPPEYFKKTYDPFQVDIFQFGCLMYTLFVEIPPFGEEVSEDNIKKIKNIEYFDPSCFADVNKTIINIIKICLNKNPGERFQSFSDILFELKNFDAEKNIKSNSYSFKIKDGKTYMTVPKNANVSVEEIENKLLEQNIFNYNTDKIKYAIFYSNGQEVEIGEVFKKIENSLLNVAEIEINKDATEAYFVKRKNIPMSMEEISFIIKKNGIRHGLIQKNIEKAVEIDAEKPILIAKATKPVDGADSYFIYFFEKDNIFRPVVENDTADYKNISVYQEVRKNDILCIKIPFTDGIDGQNVFGKPIKAKPGKDFRLPAGKNTYISSDGLKLLSTIDGIIEYRNNKINIKEIIIIHGDVDYSTGNIKYHGDVVVKGDVLPDFIIKAGGNIKIFGVAEGCHIESERGSVYIKSGVFGKEKSEIVAFKDIEAEFIQDCKVSAGQNVVVKDYVRNSTVTCGRVFICNQGIGQVDGSNIMAKRSIMINIAGTKPYMRTYLTIKKLDKYRLKEEREELLGKLKTVTSSIITVKNILKKLIIKHGDIEDLLMNSEYKLLTEKLKILENLEMSLNEKLKINEEDYEFANSDNVEFISIKSVIYPDVVLRIGNVSFKNEEEIFGNAKATIENGTIKLKVK